MDSPRGPGALGAGAVSGTPKPCFALAVCRNRCQPVCVLITNECPGASSVQWGDSCPNSLTMISRKVKTRSLAHQRRQDAQDDPDHPPTRFSEWSTSFHVRSPSPEASWAGVGPGMAERPRKEAKTRHPTPMLIAESARLNAGQRATSIGATGSENPTHSWSIPCTSPRGGSRPSRRTGTERDAATNLWLKR